MNWEGVTGGKTPIANSTRMDRSPKPLPFTREKSLATFQVHQFGITEQRKQEFSSRMRIFSKQFVSQSQIGDQPIKPPSQENTDNCVQYAPDQSAPNVQIKPCQKITFAIIILNIFWSKKHNVTQSNSELPWKWKLEEAKENVQHNCEKWKMHKTNKQMPSALFWNASILAASNLALLVNGKTFVDCVARRWPMCSCSKQNSFQFQIVPQIFWLWPANQF